MKKSSLMPLSIFIAVLAAAGGALSGILILRQKREERLALKVLNKEEKAEADSINTVSDGLRTDAEETLEELAETQEEKEDDRL